MSSGLIGEHSAETREEEQETAEAVRLADERACGYSHAYTDEMLHSCEAQAVWAAVPLKDRLRVLQEARFALAARAEELADSISPALQRSRADTLVAEVLPLLDACKFLEREAAHWLRTRKVGRKGRPFWLAGVFAEVHRVPLGRVLIIAPRNFSLFLPGVQTLQALAAGNAVVWKPGQGGEPVARLFAKIMEEAGLPANTLQVTGEGVEFATDAIQSEPDKVVFTGSSATGRRVLDQLTPRLIPAVMELSGTDAVLVLQSADLRRVARAVAFGMRLNGGAVCMSPRRLLASEQTLSALGPLLTEELKTVPPVRLHPQLGRVLETSLVMAKLEGGSIEGELCAEAQRPLLLHNAHPGIHITREAYFAPVLALMPAASDKHLPALHNRNPYGLTASIFGDEQAARVIAGELRVGSVLINDLIAPTADPRLPFGGRGESGYGVTRGPEGLLEMTRLKVVQVRRNASTRHYHPTTDDDVPFFASLIRAAHGRTLGERVRALQAVAKTARKREKRADGSTGAS